jgi:hypothetical protein
MSRNKKWIIVAALLVFVAAVAFSACTSPDSVGGSSTYTGDLGLAKLVVVSQKDWNNKGQVRHIGHHISVVRTRVANRASSGPCYRVEAEVHGDARLIDKVVQGLGHFKLCMQANDHTKILDAYTGASSSHRETWMWDFTGVDETKGAGVSDHWCNGGVGPCLPVEYRYWRFTFHWLQGVSVFGQTVGLHHKTLYVGCTLRAGGGGFHCGTGEA